MEEKVLIELYILHIWEEAIIYWNEFTGIRSNLWLTPQHVSRLPSQRRGYWNSHWGINKDEPRSYFVVWDNYNLQLQLYTFDLLAVVPSFKQWALLSEYQEIRVHIFQFV